jgi:hypothetical protein
LPLFLIGGIQKVEQQKQRRFCAISSQKYEHGQRLMLSFVILIVRQLFFHCLRCFVSWNVGLSALWCVVHFAVTERRWWFVFRFWFLVSVRWSDWIAVSPVVINFLNRWIRDLSGNDIWWRGISIVCLIYTA